jgi:ribonuclease E
MTNVELSKMLINAAQRDELRIAVLKGKFLSDFVVEYPGVQQKRSNIYKGKITRIEPSLEAAFVDFGAERQGFLPLKEIPKIYFSSGFAGDLSNVNIKEVLHEGQELIVQVEKEERGNKGAALTAFISIPGAYVVLMPNNPRAGGISRRIEGQERDEAKDKLPQLQIPEDMGVIIRTAGIGKSIEELQWDLNILLNQWSAITRVSATRQAPFLIYQEGDPVVKTIRDYLRHDLTEIIVDSPEEFEKIRDYVQQVKPDFAEKVKLYQDKIPLFSRYQIENQIETLHKREVRLPSGGSIVIDHTEALVSIDVNSAKATSGSDIEETAFNTNLEAAKEIARQLRLRDIGGLIVIDLIDMSIRRNQDEVTQSLRDALQHDRARVQVGKISSFGLLEMSRQRLRSHLGSAVQITCPRCDGQGSIRSIESLATSIVHLVEEEAAREKVVQINVQVPIDLATFLLNEKKDMLAAIEKSQEVRVYILPNQHLATPEYEIRSLRKGDTGVREKVEPSYKYIKETPMEMPEKQEVHELIVEKPAIDASAFAKAGMQPCAEAGNIPQPEKEISILKTIFKKIFGKKTEISENITPPSKRKENYYKNRRPMKHRYNRNMKGKPRRHEEKRGTSETAKTGGQQQARGGGGSQQQNTHRSQTQKRTIKGSFNQNLKFGPPPSVDYPEITIPNLIPRHNDNQIDNANFVKEIKPLKREDKDIFS